MSFAFGTLAQAQVRAEPFALQFGSEPVGSTSAPQSVTVKNDDQFSITISSVTAWDGRFSYSGPSLPIRLDPGQSLTGSVTFEPSAVQPYFGVLEFKRSTGETTWVFLIGTGAAAAASTPVAPTISLQPASEQITAGQTASFNVVATGTPPLTYQWSMNGTPISGATSSMFTTPAETIAANNTHFTAEVSNTAGNATSNAAVLSVTSANVAPAITTQPASETVIAGNTASFTVVASGTPLLAYQWSKNGTPISGATSSMYTTPVETTAANNAQFIVAVSNSAGDASSNAAILTVSAATFLLNSSLSSLSFGNVNVSSDSTQSVALTNAGNSSVTVSNVTVSGAGFTAAGVSTGQIITPGQSAALTATFAPAAAVSDTGSISVASNATNSPDSISLSGTGVPAPKPYVNMSWSPSNSAVIGYNAYSSEQTGGPYTEMNSAPVAATVYNDTAVQAGITYYFVVTAVNSNNVESVNSGEASVQVP